MASAEQRPIDKNKPVVYLETSTSCPYCSTIKENGAVARLMQAARSVDCEFVEEVDVRSVAQQKCKPILRGVPFLYIHIQPYMIVLDRSTLKLSLDDMAYVLALARRELERECNIVYDK